MPKKAGMATGVEVARISVKVSPDTDKFRSELKRELNAIEREIKGDVEVRANLDRAQAQADFDRFMEKLKTEGAKGVKIKAIIDESGGGGKGGKGGGGGGGGADSSDDLSRMGKLWNNIKSKLTEAPSFGSGINLTGMLVILTAIVAVAAPLAGIITGLMLSLPGLLSLVLTPIAAITLGLDGMKKAAETLKEPFESLKATMNQAVESQFTPVFEKLRAIFPSLASTLPSVSQGLADMAASAVGIATSPKSMAMIEGTILNIGTALSSAAPGIGNLTEGLIGLANTFTGGPLQGLVGWFNGITASFNQWIQKAQASGQLETIFNRVGEALKVVWDAMAKVVGIGLDVITDPAKWEVFIGILKAVAAAFVFIFQTSAALITTIALWVAAFRTAWAAVSSFFTNLPATASAAWQSILQFAIQIWAAVVLVVQQKIDQIKSFFSGIGEWFANGWAGIVETASSIWNSVVTTVAVAWDGIKVAVSTGIDAVVTFVTELPGKILAALGDLGGLLLGAGKAIMDGFLNGLKSAWEGVKNFVSGIAGWIADHKGPIEYDKTVLVPNGKALMEGLGRGLEDGLQPVLDQAKGMADQISAAFSSGGDPTAALAGFSKQEVNRMEKALNFQSQTLGHQIKALEYQAKQAGKGSLADSLKARADELKMIQDGVKGQKEMLDLVNDYNGANDEGKSSGNVFLDAINEFMKLPNGFLGATANQAMQDLNISGNGALQAVAGYGMDFAKKGITNIFNTSNVDDTLALHNNQVSRQARGIGGF